MWQNFPEYLGRLKTGWLALRDFFAEYYKTFRIGIRAKLSIFTASLIFLTIVVFTYTAVGQQTKLLSENYERLANLSRRHISSLVREINNIARNLIQIEEFYRQLSLQQKIRQAYRTEKVVEQQKELNLGIFKTNLFGMLGKKQVKYQVDTFYSKYISQSEAFAFERRVKAEIEKTIGKIIPDNQWQELKKLANKLVQEVRPEKILKIRSELDQKISLLLIPSYRKVMEEIGLEQDLFRIQTFPLTNIGEGETLLASFDTKLVFPDAKLSLLGDLLELEQSLKESHSLVLNYAENELAKKHFRFKHNGLSLAVFYTTLYDKPISTRLARSLLAFSPKKEVLALLQKDQEISNNLGILSQKLKKKLDELRNKKIPPYKDKEFVKNYQEYNNFVQQRLSLWAKEDDDFWTKEELLPTEVALRYLRDFFLEENLLLYYQKNENALEEFLTKPDKRKQMAKRLAALRTWISGAFSETPPPNLAKLYPEGLIAKSRSEAEEILWEFDAKPLFENNNFSVARTIMQANISSIMRTIVDETEGINLIRKNRNRVLVNALFIGILAIVLAVYSSGLVVKKIKRIIQSAEKVGQGDLNVVFEHGGHDEFGNLTDALNAMVAGLREREKIKGILGIMIDPVVVSEAMKDLTALKKGAEKEITAFFSDVASFSTISEKLTPPELASLLNEYLSAMTQILKKYEGVLDKYIGDAIVGIFNSPVEVEDHTYKAVLASLEMNEKLLELRQSWKAQGKYIPEAYEMKMRIGLNTGVAKVGFMGTDAISSYTMMGDTVNLAARLEAAAKDYGVSILVSESVFEKIKDRIFCRKLDLVRVKGKQLPVALYEVRCILGKETSEEKEFVKLYEQGLNYYFQREWDLAVESFRKAEQVFHKKEAASELLIERSLYYQENPPPDNWDGVYTRTKK